MIQRNRLWRQFEALAPEAQREVAALVARLSTRGQARDEPVKAEIALEDEPFIGMWRDREDMADSTAWVRRMRTDQWAR